MTEGPPPPASVGIDPRSIRTRDQYKLMTGIVVPRPIALVTTLGEQGPNAAPFSFFNAIGVKPPMVMLSVGPRDDGLKDTVRNLERLPEFVVHIVAHELRHRMNVCAIEFPSEVNEIERAGLRTAASVKIAPPRLIDCPVQLECRVMDMREIGRMPYRLIIGEVVHFHYHEGIVDERFNVDASRIDPLGRLAGKLNYARVDNLFSMPLLPLPPDAGPKYNLPS